MFRQGHEKCAHFPWLPHMSGTERCPKTNMAKRPGIGICTSFTDLDSLLDTRLSCRAGGALAAVGAALGQCIRSGCSSPSTRALLN